MKIYTKTGDAGETGLIGGPRVRKSDPRVEAYGELDELNATLGVASSGCEDVELGGHLARIQDQIFTLGSELASPHDTPAHARVPVVEPAWISALEQAIDAWEEELPPLRLFILPGGSRLGAALHLSRCVCRRAERRIVALSTLAEIDPQVLAYVNRLSDFLFVASRLANHRAKVPEAIWDIRRSRRP